MAVRLRALVSSPLIALAVLSLVSLAARSAWLGAPCRSPCRAAGDHILIFDESYYVNAARVIAGVRPPPNAPYATAPAGTDPNSEHPQLAKLVIAASIEVLGDGPLAWRLGSLVFGTVAIAGMYALVRAAGGGAWLGVGVAALAAADNLLLVHGRIATLDVYALAMMIWAGALYLADRPLPAGVAVGIGTAFKEVAPYVLLVFALLEAGRWRGRGEVRVRSLALCCVAAAATFLGLLAVMGLVAPPYDPGAGRVIPGGALGHLGHILSYARGQTSPGGPKGIASYPWEWLVDLGWITYLTINPARPAPGLAGYHPAAHFLGVITPPLLVAAVPALVLAVVGLLVPLVPDRALAATRAGYVRRIAGSPSACARVGVAWVSGTFLPFVALSLVWSRTSYLYYMLIVMPGMYLLAADLLARLRLHPRLLAICAILVLAGVVALYPFTPTP